MGWVGHGIWCVILSCDMLHVLGVGRSERGTGSNFSVSPPQAGVTVSFTISKQAGLATSAIAAQLSTPSANNSGLLSLFLQSPSLARLPGQDNPLTVSILCRSSAVVLWMPM